MGVQKREIEQGSGFRVRDSGFSALLQIPHRVLHRFRMMRWGIGVVVCMAWRLALCASSFAACFITSA